MTPLAEAKPKLGKYDLHEEIGHGGMATVYRATDRRLGREVAVKIIHRHLRQSEEVAARFVSEARAVAKLKHRNIVEVYDVSDDDEEARYLVVELVRGTTLRKLLAKLKYFPAEIAAAIGLELGEALKHAHESGVVHRDIKPENVLVELPKDSVQSGDSQERKSDERGPKIMITDFGIAKLLDAQGVTSTGQVLGSPAHMAPEQIEGGNVGPRSDVFSLGVLLYECMVGHLPFEGKNPAQVLRRVLDGIYSPADRERQTVGAQWTAILARALQNSPEDRYRSIDELLTDIHQELNASGFDDPRRELGEYTSDPEAYAEQYEDRTVKRLIARGEKARQAKDVPLAAAMFNRALAFRPSDAELIARVTGLARGQRLRENARRVASITGVSLLLGGLAYGVTQMASRSSTPDSNPEAVPGGRGAAPAGSTRRGATAEPVTSAAPSTSADDEKTLRLKVPPGRVWPIPSASTGAVSGKTRDVTISVVPANTLVKLDGQPIEWFGVVQKLAIGTSHRFDFLPPEGETCCTASSKVIVISDGEKPLRVFGSPSFKPAVVRVGAGPSGGTVTCPKLLLGRVLVPGEQVTVAMAGIKSTGTCTLTAPGSDPIQKSVTLRAGEAVQLTWQ